MFQGIKRWASLSNAKTTTKDALWALIEERFDDARALAQKAMATYEALESGAECTIGIIECLQIIGQCELASGAESAAQTAYQRATELVEKLSKPDANVCATVASSYAGLAAIEIRDGRLDSAGGFLESAFAWLEDVPGHKPERAFPLFQSALLACRKGSINEAENAFNAALKLILFPPAEWKNLQTLRRQILQEYHSMLLSAGRNAEADALMNRYSAD